MGQVWVSGLQGPFPSVIRVRQLGKCVFNAWACWLARSAQGDGHACARLGENTQCVVCTVRVLHARSPLPSDVSNSRFDVYVCWCTYVMGGADSSEAGRASAQACERCRSTS